MCESRLALWLSAAALAIAVVLALHLWNSPPPARACLGCEVKREAAALQEKIAALERNSLCPECRAEWDAGMFFWENQ